MAEITSRAPESLARAQRAYLESRVLGADPMELLVMLYEGLLKNVQAGKSCLEEEDWHGAQETLSKARNIVSYLTQCLRPEGEEISTRLRSLYGYCYEKIGRASLTRDAAVLDEVLGILGELSGAWTELLRSPGAVMQPPEES